MKQEAHEVDATILEDGSPKVLGNADKWLEHARERVSSRIGEYGPRPIESDSDYQQSKRERAACRKDYKELDDERKKLTRTIEDAISDFKQSCKETLAPLSDADRKYKDYLEEWDEACRQQRRGILAKEYEEFAPALAELVPFDLLSSHYSDDGKWYARSTGEAQAVESMQEAAAEIARNEKTIESTSYSDDEKRQLKAKYFSTLDLVKSLHEVAAEKEERERVARLEADRKERAEANAAAAAEAERGRLESQRKAAEAAQKAEETRQAQRLRDAEEARQRRVKTGQEADTAFSVEFRAKVTEIQLSQLRKWMNYIGIQAKFRRI